MNEEFQVGDIVEETEGCHNTFAIISDVTESKYNYIHITVGGMYIRAVCEYTISKEKYVAKLIHREL